MRTAVLSAAAALAALLGALTAPAPATAHTQLAGSTPRPGATVQQLDDIRLQFHAPLRPGGRHAIRLLGPNGARWDNARTRTVSDRELLVRVAPALPKQGEYTARWCAVPADGHPQSGAFKFSYSGATSASARPPTPNPGATSVCAAAARDGAATVVIGWLLVGVVAGSVLFVAAAAILTRRAGPGRGRRPTG